MKLIDLLKRCGRDDLVNKMAEIDDLNDNSLYDKMLERLLVMEPVESEFTIRVRTMTVRNRQEPTTFIDVYGEKPNDEDSYALEFMSWAQWLGSKVNEEDLAKHGDLTYCGEVLFEMSFVNFDEGEITKVKADIDKAVKEIKEREGEE